MNGPDKPRKVALGPALDTPEEELDIDALITPGDTEAAKADAARRGGRKGREMLEAARVEVTTDAADVAAPAIPSD